MRMKPWERVLRDKEPQGGGGGDGSGAAGFDAAKFRTELLGEVGNLLKTEIGELAKSLKPPEAPEPKPEGAPADGDGKDKADPAIAAMRREMRDLQTKLEAEQKARLDTVKAAEERERTSAVRAKLGDFQFASDTARDSALRILGGEVVRGEDGHLYGPDKTTPFDQYIQKALEETHDYLLKPKDVGGSGTTNQGGRRLPPVDLDQIKPGMSKEDRARVLADIAAHVG